MSKKKEHTLPKEIVGVLSALKSLGEEHEELKHYQLILFNKAFPNNFLAIRDMLGIKAIEERKTVSRPMVAVERDVNDKNKVEKGCASCKREIFESAQDIFAKFPNHSMYANLFKLNNLDFVDFEKEINVMKIAKYLFEKTVGVINVR